MVICMHLSMRAGVVCPNVPWSNNAPHHAHHHPQNTHAQGGFPCRRCFGHAFPCEPNDLPPALESALQDAARLHPRSPVAVVAAALTRRRRQRAGAGSAPLLVTSDGGTAAMDSIVVGVGPALPGTAPNPLLELVFTSSTPRVRCLRATLGGGRTKGQEATPATITLPGID